LTPLKGSYSIAHERLTAYFKGDNTVKKIAPSCLFLLSLPSIVWAQGNMDPSGAVVAGATVTIKNLATNAERSAQSNSSGVYDAPSLVPGRYAVQISMLGFRGAVSNVELLEVGNVNETLQMAAQSPTLETESTTLGAVVENKRIEVRPLNGRNYRQLTSLVPGPTQYGPTNFIAQARGGGDRSPFQLNIAGQRYEYNHYALDGV